MEHTPDQHVLLTERAAPHVAELIAEGEPGQMPRIFWRGFG